MGATAAIFFANGALTTTGAVVAGTAIGAIAANQMKPGAPQVAAAPPIPTQDTASNNTLQQQDALRKRRGIYANILSSSNQGAPGIPSPPANKSVLG